MFIVFFIHNLFVPALINFVPSTFREGYEFGLNQFYGLNIKHCLASKMKEPYYFIKYIFAKSQIKR